MVFNGNQRPQVGQAYLIMMCILVGHLSGCGGDQGPVRFRISGEVTYQGSPVPYGEIFFEPDGAAGNHGPATSAIIENGAYATSPGNGIVGGATIVRITGSDGKPPANAGTQIHGLPLFTEHVEKIELPKKDGTVQAFKVTAK